MASLLHYSLYFLILCLMNSLKLPYIQKLLIEDTLTPINLIITPKDNTLLILIGKTGVTYDIETHETLINPTHIIALSNNPSMSHLYAVTGDILIACGESSLIAAFSSNILLSDYNDPTSFNKSSQCSLIKGEGNYYYVTHQTEAFTGSYRLIQVEYSMKTIQIKGDVSLGIESNHEVLCEKFKAFIRQILCIKASPNLNQLTAMIIDINTKESFQKEIKESMPDLHSYQLLQSMDNEIILLIMYTKGILSAYTLEATARSDLSEIIGRVVIQGPRILFRAIEPIVSFAVGKGDLDSFVYCVMTAKRIYVQEIDLSLLVPLMKVITIDYIGGGPIGVSLGFIDIAAFIVVSSYDDNTAWLMKYELPMKTPTCHYVEYMIEIGEQAKLELISNSIDNIGMDLIIRFNPSINNQTDYALNSMLTFTSTGVFTYTATLLKVINAFQLYSSLSQCKITFSVCNVNCISCTYPFYSNDKPFICTECLPSFYLDQQTKCTPCNPLISYYYIDNANHYHCTNTTVYCTIDYPLHITNSSECIKACPEANQCLRKCPNDCIKPLELSIISMTCTCLTPEEILNEKLQVIDNPSYILALSQSPLIIQKNEYLFDIYTESMQEVNAAIRLSLNISRIDSNGLGKYKEKCGILPSDEIIVFKVDKVLPEGLTHEVRMVMYNKKGKEINCDLYNNIKLNLTLPVINANNTAYSQAKKLKAINVNAFDTNDPFYWDICFIFSNEDNHTDVTRRDRLLYYHQSNTSLCPEMTKIVGVDYATDTITCEYDFQWKQEQDSNEGKTEIEIHLPDVNMRVFTCLKTLYDIPKLSMNIGLWFSIIMMVMMIGDMIWFCVGKYRTIEIKAREIPIKEKEKDKQRDKEKGIEGQSKSMKLSKFYKEDKTKVIKAEEETKGGDNIIKAKQDSMMILGQNSSLNYSSIIHLDQSCVNSLPIIKLNNTVEGQSPVVKPPNSSFKPRIPQLPVKPITSDEYIIMSFDEIVLKDSRSFLQHYTFFLMHSHPILYTFFFSSQKSLITIKVSMFLIRLSMDFSFSAFFYLDQYISLKYTGEHTYLKDLPVSIMTYFFCSCMNFGFGFLTNSERLFAEIALLAPNKKHHAIKKAMKRYKMKIISFHIIKVIMELMNGYYVTLFCAVYANSQVLWIVSGIKSVGLTMIIPFIMTMVYTIAMRMVVKGRIIWAFKVLRFLY